MRLARLAAPTPDGVEPRIVAASPASEWRWIDVRASVRAGAESFGATSAGARRMAEAVAPGSLTAALETGSAFLDAAEQALHMWHTYPDVVVPEGPPLIAPADPPSYRDFMAFEEHFVNAAATRGREPAGVLYELPVSYMGNAQAIVGPEAEIPWPHYCEQMDFELELGIVIAVGGRDLGPVDALDRLLGFTILNDFSARDIQRREMAGGLGPSKGKHFATAIGPWIVTSDELGDEPDLPMIARVNGETWSEGRSGSLMWSIGEIVAWASAAEPLTAGALIGTGTVGGGCGLELGRFLEPGDVVELEIEGIGVLRNRIGRPAESGYVPQPRRRSRP